MPAISLLSKTYTYTNGNPNDADEVELDLANAYANFGTIQTDYNQLVTGAYTLAGVKTFSSPITLSANSNTVAGSLGYSSNVLSYYNGTKRVELTEAINANNYLSGKPPTYTSAATITIPTGVVAMDSTNAVLMEVASDQVVSLATSGANGLDTGSEASDTWYYVYLIGSSTDSATYPTKGIFSTVNEAVTGSITLPANYDIKRQLPLAVRNDGSSDILPFLMSSWYSCLYTACERSASYQVLNAGGATSFSSVDLSSFVPPTAKIASLIAEGVHSTSSGDGVTVVRPAGTTYNGVLILRTRAPGGNTTAQVSHVSVVTNSSQQIEYKRNNPGPTTSLYVYGYTVTEVA